MTRLNSSQVPIPVPSGEQTDLPGVSHPPEASPLGTAGVAGEAVGVAGGACDCCAGGEVCGVGDGVVGVCAEGIAAIEGEEGACAEGITATDEEGGGAVSDEGLLA